MNEALRWMSTQPTPVQMAIGVPATIVKMWYPRESVGVVEAAFKEQGVSPAQVREALLLFLEMARVRVSDEKVPKPIRDFLRDETGLVTVILRQYAHARGLIDVLSDLNLNVGATVHVLDRVASAFAWSPLWTVRETSEVIDRLNLYVLLQKEHVIDGTTEDYATRLLSTLPERARFLGPFKGFLGGIIDAAPRSRTLPDRARALVDFLGE